jgi:hypothetical protein
VHDLRQEEMDTQVLWDGCNTDDNEIALLGNQAVLKEELTGR